MIVETIVTNGCTCHVSDEAYKDKSQDEDVYKRQV